MRASDATTDARRRVLTRLLDADGKRLYATLVKLTLRGDAAAELLQELFVRLGTSAIETADNPAAYAWRAAINLAMEWRRRSRDEPLSIDVDIPAVAVSPLHGMIEAEQLQMMLDALAELSEASRQAFVLRHIEQQSFREAAARMGKTPHQVRGLCHAAIRSLREKFVSADRHD